MDMINIGEREKGINGKIKMIFSFIVAGILFFFTFLFIVILFSAKSAFGSISLVLGVISFTILGIIFIYNGFDFKKIYLHNDKLLNLPCMNYDKEKDIFTFTNLLNGKEIQVKKENIERIYGSLNRTSKLIYVIFLDDKNKSIKVPVGYCKNIEEASFNKSLKGILDESKYM